MAKSFESAFLSIVNPFRFLQSAARENLPEEPILEPNISRMNQSRMNRAGSCLSVYPVAHLKRAFSSFCVAVFALLRAH